MDGNNRDTQWRNLALGEPAMHRYRLPVSAIDVVLRQPAGREDLLLLDAPALDMALAMALLGSIARRADEAALACAELPAVDIDAVLLRVRQMVFGDLVRSDVTCPAPECGKRIDVVLRISDFLVHHAPRLARGVEPAGAGELGWYRLAETSVTFRIPTGGDLVAAAAERKPKQVLMRRCIRPAEIRAPVLQRVERAMEAMAPSLSPDLHATCAECGTAVRLSFDARVFTLRELCDQAAFIYEDTHLLARHYHWPEAEILALPRNRRIQYVERLRQQEEAF